MTGEPTQTNMLQRQKMCCVLIVDMVESVRLIANDEEVAVTHWLKIVEFLRHELLPRTGGRMVKSLGDGMLLQFDKAPDAMQVALGCQEFAGKMNRGVDEQSRIYLRAGLEMCEVLAGADDIYGHGVNIAARIAGLGEPGEIIISQAVRDRLLPDVHADIEDLGECFLKHVTTPVRAYRAGPVGGIALSALRAPAGFGNLLPTIAVIPFSGGEHDVLGDVLAEELINALSRSTRMNVISRLTTTQLSREGWTARQFGENLHANFVLTGTCRDYQGKLMIGLELAETRSQEVVWADRFNGSVDELLSGEREMVYEIVNRLGSAILKREIARAGALPLPNLESYSLLLGAIGAMYRLSKSEFERARLMLDAVIDRVPRHPLPLAWLGNWHVLKVQQGWSDDPDAERRQALARTHKALDLEPDNAHALTFEGFVHTNLSKQLDVAEERYDAAIASNPNAGLAWLLKGTMLGFRGEGKSAIECSIRAQSLSPLDPQRFFYDCLTAGAYLTDGDYETAHRFARASLKANRTHTSSLRVLAVAKWKLGKESEAKETVRKLLELEPSLTVSRWLKNSPSAVYSHGKDIAETLRLAGVPD